MLFRSRDLVAQRLKAEGVIVTTSRLELEAVVTEIVTVDGADYARVVMNAPLKRPRIVIPENMRNRKSAGNLTLSGLYPLGEGYPRDETFSLDVNVAAELHVYVYGPKSTWKKEEHTVRTESRLPYRYSGEYLAMDK